MGSSKPRPNWALSRGLGAATGMFLGRSRRYVGWLLLLAAVGWGFHAAWQRWGRPALLGPEFTLTPDALEVTPQPEWIRANVKAEVARDAQLAEMRLLDPKLTEKVSRAFALHSWVAQVRQVRKEYPARVVVDLEYRQPVAMVEVDAQQGPGLLFVDSNGVLLPSDDLEHQPPTNYLRVHVPRTAPAGPYGTAWGDPRIVGAARLASVLRDVWQKANLRRIHALEVPGGRVVYELESRDGQHIRWGHAPGLETNQEPAVAQKLQSLVAAAGNLPTALDGRE